MPTTVNSGPRIIKIGRLIRSAAIPKNGCVNAAVVLNTVPVSPASASVRPNFVTTTGSSGERNAAYRSFVKCANAIVNSRGQTGLRGRNGGPGLLSASAGTTASLIGPLGSPGAWLERPRLASFVWHEH